MGFRSFALRMPEAGEAGGSAEFKGFRVLSSRDLDGALEKRFDCPVSGATLVQNDLALESE